MDKTDNIDYCKAECPSCRPTNNVKALKRKISHSRDLFTPCSPGVYNIDYCNAYSRTLHIRLITVKCNISPKTTLTVQSVARTDYDQYTL